MSRLFSACAGVSALAAAGVAVLRAQNPFEHGWWLVAYLFLVGACAQFLLGRGQQASVERPDRLSTRRLTAELVLWNLGVALVPVGVFADSTAAVDAGTVSLLAALWLFATAVERGPARWARLGAARRWGYRALVVFMAGSAVVGTGLAGALPWQ